jgi:hypothetical protein
MPVMPLMPRFRHLPPSLPPCRGTYWGEMGFFRVERGVNAVQIESGDCWWVEVAVERASTYLGKESDYISNSQISHSCTVPYPAPSLSLER